MAKKKCEGDDSFDSFFKDLADKTGGDVLSNVDSIKYFVDTGSLALNYICSGRFIGGGVPGGKLTEIYGPNSSSKSLIGSNILFGCQRMNGIGVLMDCENSVNQEFVEKASHCNLNRLVTLRPESLEEVFSKIYKIVDVSRQRYGADKPIVIVYDSIGVSPSARELKEVKLPEKFSVAQFKAIVGGREQPGERAKICSREFRKLNTVMEKNNVTVIILNQTRDKIGTFHPTKVTAGGGQALPFYASCRIETAAKTKIDKKITETKKKILGINIKMKNVKNKTHRPFIESENISLLFDLGVNPISGLLSCLMDAERVVVSSKGNFAVKPNWSNGQEVKFKASQVINNVPLDILLKCPALIDAENEEEVIKYLEPFMAAVNFHPEQMEDVEMNTIGEFDIDDVEEEESEDS